ncbi:hypothetical protein GGR57DRAFT_485974 [Xylariaceae sp. FL1272]|nr:hypothetical protein GGR57DRAFT_485974 [Xylariaceae sp. FL1272]
MPPPTMHPRGALHARRLEPISEPNNRYPAGPSAYDDESSSDEDDEGIPATISPLKRPAPPVAVQPSAATKRTLSGKPGLVFYPGSKRRKMADDRRMPRCPPSTSTYTSSSPSVVYTPPRRPSTHSFSPDNHVQEGLLSSVNAIFRLPHATYGQQAGDQDLFTAGDGELGAEPLSLGLSTPTTMHRLLCGVGDRFDDSARPMTDAEMNAEILPGADSSPILPAQAPTEVMMADTKFSTSHEPVIPATQFKPDIWEIPSSPPRATGETETYSAQPVKRGRPRKVLTPASQPSLSHGFPDSLKSTINGSKHESGLLIRNGSAEPGVVETTDHLLQNQDTVDQLSDSASVSTRSQYSDADVVLRRPRSESQESGQETGLFVTQEAGVKTEADGEVAESDNEETAVTSNTDPYLLEVTDEETSDSDERDGQYFDNAEDNREHLEDDPDEVQNHDDDNSTDDESDEDGLSMTNDFEDESDYGDVDLSARETFERDVEEFRNRAVVDVEDSGIFECPSDENLTAVYLDHVPLRRICSLLVDTAWLDTRAGWQDRPLSTTIPETKSAQALISVLSKLERLYIAIPRAPHLEGQRDFISSHADLLNHYFHKIQRIVDHIRQQRLGDPHHPDPRYRKRVARDLVRVVLPMLIHSIAAAWSLGGKDWAQGNFTTATVELLRRGVGWSRLLYSHLQRELKLSPLEKKPESKYRQMIWRKLNEKRMDLKPVLDNLREVIADAPDQLATLEARQHEEAAARRHRILEEQKRSLELAAERQRKEEAEKAASAERQRRAIMSMRGIHYPLVSSSAPPSEASRSMTPKVAAWSSEEKTFLFRKIQEAYPRVPNLDQLHWELNKSVDETAKMTEKLLKKMLAAVKPEQTEQERDGFVQRMMKKDG